MDLLNSLGLVPNQSIAARINKFGLIIGNHETIDALLQLVAYLSITGPVRVLDGGNPVIKTSKLIISSLILSLGLRDAS